MNSEGGLVVALVAAFVEPLGLEKVRPFILSTSLPWFEFSCILLVCGFYILKPSVLNVH